MRILDLLRETGALEDTILEGDSFDIELDDLVIESTVVDVLPDGIVISADDTALAYLGINENYVPEFEFAVHYTKQSKMSGRKILASTPKFSSREEAIQAYEKMPKDFAYEYWIDKITKTPKGLKEAEYQGRKVPLGKPMAGDVKKSKVYVKGPSGRVVKVNFGDKKMKIKKSNPKRRKSFRARHNCANPGPRHKARYWSCRAWE